MTTPLGGTSAALPTAGASSTTTTGKTGKPGESAMGPDAFMKLLVAQLKYQNPMAPADGQAYMTQMATFTQVEKLDQLVKAQADAVQWQQRVSAEGLVGRSVTGTTDGRTSTGTVVGVRYAEGKALLELSDGTTLAPGSVERVQNIPAPAPAVGPATAPAADGTAPTATSTTTTTSTTSSSTTSTVPSTTAAPAGTPSA